MQDDGDHLFSCSTMTFCADDAECGMCFSRSLDHLYVEDADTGHVYLNTSCRNCKTVVSSRVDVDDQLTDLRNQADCRFDEYSADDIKCRLLRSTKMNAKKFLVYDRTASGDWINTCKTGDVSAIKSKQTRRLKSSQSVNSIITTTTHPDYSLGDSEHLRRPASDDDLTYLSHKNLKRAREWFMKSLCCPSCTAFGSDLVRVDGMAAVFSCSCGETFGLDDSMNYYEVIERLQSHQYLVEPCPQCGNNNPDKFLVDISSYDPGTVNLKCLECLEAHGNILSYNAASCAAVQDNDGSESTENPMPLIECRCQNRNPELFIFSYGKTNDPVSVECLNCGYKLHFHPTVCSCPTDNEHEIEFDEFGYVCKVVCRQCKVELDCGAMNSTPRANCDGTPVGRTQVVNIAMMKRGDHIAWHQPLSYWHHAIVIEVDECNNAIKIINYDGPDVHKGKIVEDYKIINVGSEQLYVINYQEIDCFHPDEVIRRARTRLDETNYHLLNNNCEHFARWCKTGCKRSLQAESFFRAVQNRVANVVSYGMKYGAGMLKRAAFASGASGKDIAAKEASSSLLPAGLGLSAAIIVAAEVKMVCHDIKDAYDKRLAQNITREEFIKITIKRASEGVGSMAGMAVALVIPLFRNSAGMTLGSLIGQSIGSVVGRQLAVAYDNLAPNGRSDKQ